MKTISVASALRPQHPRLGEGWAMKPYQKLLNHWVGQAPPYERVVVHGEAEVAALEQRYGIRAPADFRDYLLHAAPTAEPRGEMDDDNVSWWGLDRIKSIPEEYRHPLADGLAAVEASKALFFADMAVWCWAWAICCADGPDFGRVVIVSGGDTFVADTFSEFVDKYLADRWGRALMP